MKTKHLFKPCLVLSLTAVLLIVTGCKDLPTPGNYRGNLSVHDLPLVEVKDATPIRMSLTYGHHHLTAELFNPLDTSSQSFVMQPWTFTQKDKDTIEASIPDYKIADNKAIKLKKMLTSSGHCYRTTDTISLVSPSAVSTASLCFDRNNFTFSLSHGETEVIHLYATQFEIQPVLKLEAPQRLTVSEGARLIVDKNYDAQEAKQSLIRANENANRAYLNLLPSVSVGGAIALTNFLGSYFEPNRPGNDFVPFLFPGRWLIAKALTWQARAERVSYTMFKLNTGTSVQTQAIAFRNHRELRDQIQALQAQLIEALKIAEDLGAQNRMDPNSILTIRIALSDLNINLWQAQNQFMQDKIGLSQTLGFENPETVEDISLGEETTPIEQIPVLADEELLKEKNRYAELAINNSFELRQLDYLHHAAVINAKNVFVNWLDVFAVMDLGANLSADIRLAKSMVRSVEINSEKTRQTLISRAYNLLRDRNLLRQSYDVLETSLVKRTERLNLLIQSLRQFAANSNPNGKIPVTAGDIRGSVRDVAIGLMGFYNTQAAILIDQAALDRIALQGVYIKYLPHLEGVETP